MNIILTIIIIIFLSIIVGLLNEVLGELRLAKKDREDDRSQKENWIDPRRKIGEEE